MEFLRDGGPSGWEFKFDLPNGLATEDLKPEKINKLEYRDGLFNSERKEFSNDRLTAKIKQDIANISFDLNDDTDESEENNSMNTFIKKWIGGHYSDFDEQSKNFLTLFEYTGDDSDDASMYYRLKKPLNDLSDEEKELLKETLFSFGITDLSSWYL